MLDRFFKWAFQLDRPTKRAIQIMADLFLIVGCFILAMGLRYDDWGFLTGPRVWDVLIFVVPVTLLAYVRAGLYRAVIRFISSRAIKAIVISIMISGATMMIANLALGHLIPRSVPLIFAVLLFCATAGTRFAVRGITHSISRTPKENVVIYGAGDAGRQLLNALISEGEYKVIAFVDDDPSMQGREVDTIKIRAPDDLGDLKQRMMSRVLMRPRVPGCSNATDHFSGRIPCAPASHYPFGGRYCFWQSACCRSDGHSN